MLQFTLRWLLNSWWLFDLVSLTGRILSIVWFWSWLWRALINILFFLIRFWNSSGRLSGKESRLIPLTIRRFLWICGYNSSWRWWFGPISNSMLLSRSNLWLRLIVGVIIWLNFWWNSLSLRLLQLRIVSFFIFLCSICFLWDSRFTSLLRFRRSDRIPWQIWAFLIFSLL